jgi:probable HAF family extracellular repeat protein
VFPGGGYAGRFCSMRYFFGGSMLPSPICRVESLESRRLLTYTLADLSLVAHGGEGLEQALFNSPDVNNPGAVVASKSVRKGIRHAMLRVERSGSPTLIDVGNFSRKVTSYGYGVNTSNQTVGAFIDSKGLSHAFTSTLGGGDAVTVRKLPDAKGLNGAIAYAVNSGGLAVGSGGNETAREQGLAWEKDSNGNYSVVPLRRLGTRPVIPTFIATSIALDVNDDGVIAGMAFNNNTRQRAVIWKKNSSGYAVTDLGALRGGLGESYGAAINETGQVVGFSGGSDFKNHAVLFSPNSKGRYSVINLPMPAGADGAQATDISETGVIVGQATFGNTAHAMLWRKNSKGKYSALDLNSQLPGGSGWSLTQSTAINDDGTIVGAGRHSGAAATWMLKPAGKGSGITVASLAGGASTTAAASSTPFSSTRIPRIAEQVLL